MAVNEPTSIMPSVIVNKYAEKYRDDYGFLQAVGILAMRGAIRFGAWRPLRSRSRSRG